MEATGGGDLALGSLRETDGARLTDDVGGGGAAYPFELTTRAGVAGCARSRVGLFGRYLSLPRGGRPRWSSTTRLIAGDFPGSSGSALCRASRSKGVSVGGI
jgi:hypothetical protein